MKQENTKLTELLIKLFDKDIYQVGGVVRDEILNRPCKDMDFLVINRDYNSIANDLSYYGKTYLVGKSFGIIKFKPNEMDITVDIAIPRTEKSVGVGHRDFEVNTKNVSLQDDLDRRDFTMNALAKNLLTGKITDIVEGQRDIDKKLICVITSKSFTEDPLRMIRACRFASQLNFQIGWTTQNLIIESAELIKTISGERIQEELNKILVSDKPSIGLRYLSKLGLMMYIVPEVELLNGIEQPKKYHMYDAFIHTMETVDQIKNDLTLRLTALLHDVGKVDTQTIENGEIHFYEHEDTSVMRARDVMLRLKYPNDISDRVLLLIKHHLVDLNLSRKGIRKLIAAVGVDNIYDLLEHKRADKLASLPDNEQLEDIETLKLKVEKEIKNESAFSIKDLDISGEDIMKILNIPPGPKVGEVLKSLFDKVMDNPELNEKETLIKLVV